VVVVAVVLVLVLVPPWGVVAVAVGVEAGA